MDKETLEKANKLSSEIKYLSTRLECIKNSEAEIGMKYHFNGFSSFTDILTEDDIAEIKALVTYRLMNAKRAKQYELDNLQTKETWQITKRVERLHCSLPKSYTMLDSQKNRLGLSVRVYLVLRI